MASEDVLIEAHSYSGGLRYTAFHQGGARPAWVPAADSVGWRDDFALDGDDAVIEFHQRAQAGTIVSWIAVYRRSKDAQFGDRSNHCGIGVWLRGKRIADARSLLLSLDLYTTALAQTPDPHTLDGAIAEFDSDRFLGRYLLSADLLPRDWAGAPAAATALVETQYQIVRAPSFSFAVDRAADRITWLSLGWAPQDMCARTIILATSRATSPAGREFKELDPPGGVLAEIVARIPGAFEEERRLSRSEASALGGQRQEWERQRQFEQQQFEEQRREAQAQLESERQQLQTLEGQPATAEGIAIRLNTISRQLAALTAAPRSTPAPARVLEPRAAQTRRQYEEYGSPKPDPRPAPSPAFDPSRNREHRIAMIVMVVLSLFAAGGAILWGLQRYFATDPTVETSSGPADVPSSNALDNAADGVNLYGNDSTQTDNGIAGDQRGENNMVPGRPQ